MTVLSDRVDALEATNANLVTILSALQGTLQAAVDAGQGPQGWSPVLTVQSDGARRVLQVTDWTGGGAGATKPATGDYIGSTGLEPLIADAIDIRGPSGADGAAGADGNGWTGATYDAGTGIVTFASDDGLGFTTGDLRGDKGDPGALFNWTGPWVTATAYAEGDGVESGGSSYVCISAHTSGATTEPGVGGSWATVWDLTAAKGDPGSGDVSSVDVTGGTGITSTGGPITSTGSITVALDSATQTSLGLADTSVQPGDDADTLGSGAATDGQVLTADGAGGAAWESASGAATVFKSGLLTFPNNSTVTWAHGLGSAPDVFGAYAVWKGSTQTGFASGDRIDIKPGSTGGGELAVYADGTNVTIALGAASTTIGAGDASGSATLDSASADIVLWAME